MVSGKLNNSKGENAHSHVRNLCSRNKAETQDKLSNYLLNHISVSAEVLERMIIRIPLNILQGEGGDMLLVWGEDGVVWYHSMWWVCCGIIPYWYGWVGGAMLWYRVKRGPVERLFKCNRTA